MRSTMQRTSEPLFTGVVLGALVLGVALAGCAHSPNQFREDGPAASLEWDTPTAQDVRARAAPADMRVHESAEWPTDGRGKARE